MEINTSSSFVGHLYTVAERHVKIIHGSFVCCVTFEPGGVLNRAPINPDSSNAT